MAQGYKLKLKDDILIFENPKMMELASNSLAKIPLNFQNLLRDQMNISQQLRVKTSSEFDTKHMLIGLAPNPLSRSTMSNQDSFRLE